MHHKPSHYRPTLAFLICFLWALPTFAGEFDHLRERISRAVVQQSLPSIAVAVARDGQIVWEEGFGWADRENRVEANEHTMYSLASISKPNTATGLMVLVERGKLDLARPANDYLGAAKINGRAADAAGATLLRLTNHTSGLPLHYQFFYENEPYRRPSMDETIRRYANLVTPPGEREHYSNLAVGIVDYIIQRTSGRSYADFMRSEVFLPLGMTHSSVDVGPGLEAYQAVRYTPDGQRIPFYDFDHPGASAVYSSAHDLIRFAMFHMKDHLDDQKAILSDDSIDAMQQPTATLNGKPGTYGISWGLRTGIKGYRTVSHTGGMPGVSTSLVLVPEANIAVTVLCNTRSNLPDGIAATILKHVLPPRDDSSPVAQAVAFAARANPENFQPGEELVGLWQGIVATPDRDIPAKLWIFDSGDVHLQLGDQLKSLVNHPRLHDGYLTGVTSGNLGTEDANRMKYYVELDLKLRDDVLNGSLIARSNDRLDVRALAHWMELKKDDP